MTRKYRNGKGNSQPKRILKYSEEWIQYRKLRGADSVKVAHCDTDDDGHFDAIVRAWRHPALKKSQICLTTPPFGPDNVVVSPLLPEFGPDNVVVTPLLPEFGPDNVVVALAQAVVPGAPENLQSVLTTDVPIEPVPGVNIPVEGQAVVSFRTGTYYIDSNNDLNLLGNTASYEQNPPSFRYYIPQHIASDVKSIHSGNGGVMFYEKTDGTVYGFGGNLAYVLSETVRSGTFYATNPVQQNLGANFLKISSWESNVIVLKTDGSMWGRGQNAFNNLGLSSDSEQQTLVQLEANGIIDIACGGDSTLFVKNDNRLFGVGGNNFGTLGLGHSNYLGQTPAVEITQGVSKCYSGYRTSYFIKTDGQLFGMGQADNGALGQGNSIDRTTPVFIDSNVLEAFPGHESLLYIKNDNTLWGFGKGLTEAPVQYATDVVSASSGSHAAAANETVFLFQKNDGSLWGWGYNSGQLGPQNGKNEFDGTTYNNPVTLKRSV